MFQPQSAKPDFTHIFESVHTYWSENHIFEKSVEERSEANQFRFYDGPPFVTGLPHYGHLASSVAKDVIPRFQTMKGKKVERVRGRDCHGIPIEQKVQTKLGLASNLDIENVGIETFINECYNYTRSTSSEWKRYIDQFARWVDFDHSYKTMDNDYMESVRRVFKTLWEKGLIYKGKRVSLYSTKLETPISNFEVAMDDTYEEVNDPAITVAFDLSINGGEYDNTSILVWTTTPWTIPVNIAAGVHKELEYSKIEYGNSYYILASSRVETVFMNKEYKIVETFLGEKLVGLSYQPPYEYLYGKTNNNKDHKIYHADFVSDSDGTGVVHEAPEFGEVDFQLAKQIGLTVTEAMDSSGHYTEIMGDKSGIFYRDANPIILQELHDMGKLFHKASITHRVAFCPRSGTPLVYKAQDSWFIDINGKQEIFGGKSLKDKCIEANEDINRYPEHNKHGRFLKSIEAAPDWGISRTRYWGTPMPVYKSSDGKDILVIGSREELYQLSKNGSKNINKILLIRHGETVYNNKKKYARENNIEFHYDSRVGDNILTTLGTQQAQELKINLQKEISNDSDIIYYLSPLLRVVQTIDPYFQEHLGYTISDLEEYQSIRKKFDDESLQENFNFNQQFSLKDNIIIDFRLTEKHINNQGIDVEGEVFTNRIKSFITNLNQEYTNKTIVIISHAYVNSQIIQTTSNKDVRFNNCNIKTIYRHTNRNAELDLHRPFIDDVWFEKDGVKYNRISEVLDCWVESASMPYAQVHYPFENKEKFENSFPADYVVEYTGQVRAWFYVMHVLGVALFDKPAFKNVICHGVIAGNDGRKMSKSFGNYPDPKPTFAQYGGDAVRMSILTTSLFNGGDMSFSEDLILEALKQNILPLWNAFSFFTTYANIDQRNSPSKQETAYIAASSQNRLDTWILGELDKVTSTIDHDLTHYDLTHASRQIASFLENLTNWYIRRSRRRFWKSDSDEDKSSAYTTLYTVLTKFCVIASPFMPIISEYIWKALTGDDINNSVHLQEYPNIEPKEKNELSDTMNVAQNIVRMGLAARSKNNIRVRQPLGSLILGTELDSYYMDIISEELNIKNLSCDLSLNDHVTKICKPDGKIVGELFGNATKDIFALAKSGQFVQGDDGAVVVGTHLLPAGSYEISYIKKDANDDIEVDNGIVMKIDWTITPELEREGYARDLIRAIQDARKEANYDIADRIQIRLEGSSVEDIINHHGSTIQEETLSTIQYTDNKSDISKTIDLGGNTITFHLSK